MNTATNKFDGNYPEGVAVVIGGSGGIGKGICLALAEHGARVALSYRSNASAAQQTVTELQQLGHSAEAFALELSSLEQVSAALGDLQARHQRIHTLVFAAGANITMTYVGDIDPVEWHQTIDGELNGFFHVIKTALPHAAAVRRRGRGAQPQPNKARRGGLRAQLGAGAAPLPQDWQRRARHHRAFPIIDWQHWGWNPIVVWRQHHPLHHPV